MNIFKRKAKLKEFGHQDPYIYRLDSSVNISLYLLITYASVHPSPSIEPFYCLYSEENFSIWGPVIGGLQTDIRQMNRRRDKAYLYMHVGVFSDE